MRASTIFALCLALLVGLAAAVVNRVRTEREPVENFTRFSGF